MSESYLILHKVRGEPAFDIATQIEATEGGSAPGHSSEVVWIIPTSGHRAYPCWHIELSRLGWKENTNPSDDCQFEWRHLPEGEINLLMLTNPLPDHYACNETPKPKPPTRVIRPTTTDDFAV